MPRRLWSDPNLTLHVFERLRRDLYRDLIDPLLKETTVGRHEMLLDDDGDDRGEKYLYVGPVAEDRFASRAVVVGTGLDYSAGVITSGAIRGAGHTFVIRYVDDPAVGLGRKHIRGAEYAELTRGGVTVWLVFEIATTDMLGGFNAGVANARRALTGARAVGYPDDQPIFMACDMHLSAGQIPACLAYIDGAATVLGRGRTGVYGFPELISASQGHGAVFWQCGHNPGPGGLAHIWQRNDGFTTVGGISCDINVIYHPLPGGAAPAAPPAAPPVIHQLGEDHQMHVYSPEPAPGVAKHDWPTRTVTFGFDPAGGWGGQMVLHAEWGTRGGWIHGARWWVRDPNKWSANTPIHYPQDHPIGANGNERFIGYGWVTPPPAGADCIELTFSAPDGLHLFSFYEK